LANAKLFGAIQVIQFMSYHQRYLQNDTHSKSSKQGVWDPKVQKHPTEAIEEIPISPDFPAVEHFTLLLGHDQSSIEGQGWKDFGPKSFHWVNDESTEETCKAESEELDREGKLSSASAYEIRKEPTKIS
jgi:hypothetical protein